LFVSSAEDNKYIVLVSGLMVGSMKSNPLQFQLLVDYVTGHSGDEQVCHFFSSDVMMQFFLLGTTCIVCRKKLRP
jgi:hypothetical protein